MNFRHTLLAVFINLIWGSMFIAATIGLREFPPIFFTGVRFVLLFLCLIHFIKVPLPKIKPLITIGLLLGSGMYLALYLSIALAENTASIALFNKLEVPFAMILGVVLLKEKVDSIQITGILIAMSGAAVISFHPSALNDQPALFWMAICCAFAAVGMIKVRLLTDVHALTITAWISLVGSATLLLTSFVFEDHQATVLTNASWVGWAALIYTAVMSSFVANSGLFYLLQHYPVSQVAPYSLLSPVFAVVGGVLFLQDELTPGLINGGVLILAGVGLIHLRAMAMSRNNKVSN